MTRAELKAMGVRVVGTAEPDRGRRTGSYGVWIYGDGGDFALIADGFPTRKAAEQYARQLRRAMRGDL